MLSLLLLLPVPGLAWQDTHQDRIFDTQIFPPADGAFQRLSQCVPVFVISYILQNIRVCSR